MNNLLKGICVFFVLTFCSQKNFAQSEIDTVLLKGNWLLKSAAIRCKGTRKFDDNNFDWPVKTLSFHDNQTVGLRDITEDPGIYNTFYGRYVLRDDTLFCTPNVSEAVLDTIQPLQLSLKKVTNKSLVYERSITIKTLPFLTKSHVYKATVFYNRLDDLSEMLQITKIGSLWVENTEVLNAHWLDYEAYHLLRMDSASFAAANIESPFKAYRNQAAGMIPMTMITYEQALAYCKWRSQHMSRMLGRKITFRLPTIKEWQSIASAFYKENESKINKELLANKKYRYKHEFQNKYFTFKSSILSEDIVHLFDNVSEMTAAKGKALGGNNNLYLPVSENLTRVFQYEKAQFSLVSVVL